MTDTHRTPVHIITGYLGAGKTTFLNQVLRHRKPERLMIIENEVGQTNVDSQLILGSTSDNVLELTSGCLCCSLNEELMQVLRQAAGRRQQYDRLVIETTGVADPESIVLPFVSAAAVEQVFELQNTICLVDAQHVEHWLSATQEAKRQIAFADVILLNKADLVSDAYLNTIKQLVKNINPHAHTYTGQHGEYPIDEILSIRQLTDEHAAESIEALPDHHQHHVHGISTFTLSYERPFNLETLVHECYRMVKVNRHQIYRIKGIINARDYPVQVVLQSVRDTILLTDGKLWQAGPKISKVVFIGKELERKAIEKIMSRHLL